MPVNAPNHSRRWVASRNNRSTGGTGHNLFGDKGLTEARPNAFRRALEGGPDGIPERLISGYATFRGNRLSADRERYRRLAEHGQHPEIMIIACCDSRSAPGTADRRWQMGESMSQIAKPSRSRSNESTASTGSWEGSCGPTNMTANTRSAIKPDLARQ